MIVAVVGGGQLARMMAAPATALGITLRVLVEEAGSAAAFAAHEVVVGAPSDQAAVARLLSAPIPDVVTWEHEHIPGEVFDACAAAGVPARPGQHALLYAQDKIAMRSKMEEMGVPSPRWAPVASVADVENFLESVGGRAVLKTARGGYDGKGVRVISAADEAADWIAAAVAGGPQILVEEAVPFVREVAIQVARSPQGQIAAWPLVESVQRGGVCSEVIAPAPDLSPELASEASEIARRIATELDVTGDLAVEMFQVGDQLLVNELAMRPHNSGHWSIDGAVTCQFEQHLRAVLGLPLGDTSPLAPVSVMANILGGSRADLVSALPLVSDPGVKIHLYGKSVKPGRKVGHVTVVGKDAEAVYERAVSAAAIVKDQATDRSAQ